MPGSRLRLAILAILATVVLAGCGDDTTLKPESDPFPIPISQGNVLSNLAYSWRQKRIDVYSSLLADDFRFYFDEDTRIRKGLPVFWTRVDDTTSVKLLFDSPYTRMITISLDGVTGPVPASDLWRETWTRVDVRNTFLEVTLNPSPEHPDGPTLRVNGSLQHFFFRRGRNPGDTLAASPTSHRYYIVEWDDMGMSASSGSLDGHSTGAPMPGLSMVEWATWGGIKSAYK
jgi:hypothetical protein